MTLPAEFARFPKEWRVLTFLEAVSDATAGNPKIKVEDYLDTGILPIVDQGQEQFNGYTDDPGLACDTELPAIVFGDHTRRFKFIETPFALGADGAKLLKPKAKFDLKFLYYYLSQLKIESAGYSRHYKFLKETYVPVPPLETQKHIARVLEQADQLRKQAQQMESELNQLAQSLFLEMFGDPATNPKNWPRTQLSDIASSQLGKMLSEKAKKGVSPKKYLRNANVRWRSFDLDDLLEMDFSEKEMKKFELQFGDLLVCEGGEVGRCAIWRNQLSDCYYQKALHRVRVKKATVTPEYLQEYFYWMATLGGLTKSVSEVTFSHLTAERLNDLKVPVPPYKLQEQYSEKIASVEKQRQLTERLQNRYEDTFNTLMQRAFNGELTAPGSKAA